MRRVSSSRSTSLSLIHILFNAGDLGYQTTVIKQDGDNKVSNRDFSLGLNVGSLIAQIACVEHDADVVGRSEFEVES